MHNLSYLRSYVPFEKTAVQHSELCWLLSWLLNKLKCLDEGRVSEKKGKSFGPSLHGRKFLQNLRRQGLSLSLCVSLNVSYRRKQINLLLYLYSSRFPMTVIVECTCPCSSAKNSRLGEPDSAQATCVKLFSIATLVQNVLAGLGP